MRRELISSIGSERATSGNGNKIVTVDGRTHIVWQDAKGDVWIGYVAPDAIVARHGIADRAEVVKKMTGALEGLSAGATKP